MHTGSYSQRGLGVYDQVQVYVCVCVGRGAEGAPQSGSSAAGGALGRHQAGQQVQGAAALGPEAGQHIAVGMHKTRREGGPPGLVAVGALGGHLDGPPGALLTARGHRIRGKRHIKTCRASVAHHLHCCIALSGAKASHESSA